MAFLWQIGIISSRSLLYLIGYNGSSAQQMLRGLDSRVWQGLTQADCRRAYMCRERVIGGPSFSDRIRLCAGPKSCQVLSAGTRFGAPANWDECTC
jgi:hypothetical protein